MEVIELQRKKARPVKTEEMKDKLAKLRKEHDKLVKGKFEFLDAQGGWLDFTYRFFPGDSIQQYHFEHGEVCEIPMGIVKHLNNTVKKVRKPNREILEGGKMTPLSVEFTSRIRFTPVDFL